MVLSAVTSVRLYVDTNTATSSALKKKAVCSSETSVFTYKVTQRYNPEDQHQHFTAAVATSNLTEQTIHTQLTNSILQDFSLKFEVALMVKKSLPFMKTESSLPCLQNRPIKYWSQPTQSIPGTLILFL
jgi:hypothetical protein